MTRGENDKTISGDQTSNMLAFCFTVNLVVILWWTGKMKILGCHRQKSPRVRIVLSFGLDKLLLQRSSYLGECCRCPIFPHYWGAEWKIIPEHLYRLEAATMLWQWLVDWSILKRAVTKDVMIKATGFVTAVWAFPVLSTYLLIILLMKQEEEEEEGDHDQEPKLDWLIPRLILTKYSKPF